MSRINLQWMGKVRFYGLMVALSGGLVGGLVLPGRATDFRTDEADKLKPSVSSVPLSAAKLSRPATTVKEWVAQIEAATVQVTSVALNRTDKGLEIALQTAEGKPLQVDATKFRTEGTSLIADIPNAVLALPEGQAFSADNPTADIATVRVTQQDANTIRISVAGTDKPPTSEVTLKAGEFAYSLNPEADEPDEEIVVTGQQDGYRVPNATTATKTDTPIRDIPASIQVIPQEVIRDQNATSIREVVRNVSGVTFSTSAGNRAEQFIARGFGAERFLNGFREDFFSTRTQTELANIDRIEVLKGPASVLFGQANPSGIINFVTKQPLRDPFYNVSFTAGSFSFYRPTLDFSGPLTADRTLAYRLNIAYENAGSFRDRVQTERFFVAPTLTWQISPDTRIGLEVSYLHDARPIDRGLVVLSNNRVANIPFSRYLGDPERREDFNETRAAIYFDHRFNPNLSLRSALRYTVSTESGIGATLQITGGSRNDRNFPLTDFIGDQYYDTLTFQNDLIGKFKTGSIEHKVLFGLELSRGFRSSFSQTRSAGTIDIFNPSYNFTFGPFGPRRTSETRANSFGVYLQDQITLLENLKLVLGGRFDTYRSEDIFNGDATETNAEAFSPRVGIVYQPIPEVSLYASYSRSFTPVSGTDVRGTPFEPQRGTGYEVGVKTELSGGRLSSTLAFYDTTLSNILTEDLNNSDFSVQVGEQRSRGIEFDIAGKILPGWKVIATYAYTDASITKDNTLAVGNRLNNVPRHGASLWTTYTLQAGSWKGFGFGAGMFFVGERTGDLRNSFFVDGYTRFDATLFYERNNFRVALNFKNLTDIRFIEGTQSRQQVIPGAPFTVLGTISYTF
jgi:iron complex outermembrane receptor protein